MPAQEIIPSGIALNSSTQEIKTLVQTQLASLQALSDLTDNLLYILSSVLEKLPRLDANDRVLMNGTEVTSPVSLAALPTLGTVTTVTGVTAVTALQNMNTGNVAHLPYTLSAGAPHIYDNITVT